MFSWRLRSTKASLADSNLKILMMEMKLVSEKKNGLINP